MEDTEELTRSAGQLRTLRLGTVHGHVPILLPFPLPWWLRTFRLLLPPSVLGHLVLAGRTRLLRGGLPPGLQRGHPVLLQVVLDGHAHDAERHHAGQRQQSGGISRSVRVVAVGRGGAPPEVLALLGELEHDLPVERLDREAPGAWCALSLLGERDNKCGEGR